MDDTPRVTTLEGKHSAEKIAGIPELPEGTLEHLPAEELEKLAAHYRLAIESVEQAEESEAYAMATEPDRPPESPAEQARWHRMLLHAREGLARVEQLLGTRQGQV